MDDLRQAFANSGCSGYAAEVSESRGLSEDRGIAGDRGSTRRFGDVGDGESSEERMARLVRTIEGEIIPRLMLAHRAAVPNVTVPSLEGGQLGLDEVSELARLVLDRDAGVALDYVEGLIAQGVSLERLYLDLLAPTAQRLGELWEEDLCDFTDVTVGLCRLHQMLWELSPTFRSEAQHRDHGRRALLAPVPGEQHGFGLVMVGEFFRRAGWDVWSGPGSSKELVEMVRAEWFAVVGLSMSCGTRLDTLASAIRAIRRASLNPAIGVMVGGRVFATHPQLVALVGADATAGDASQAVERAEDMLALLARGV
jgi:MerR family transcriptional regulator, light-induced transcriptional regulator